MAAGEEVGPCSSSLHGAAVLLNLGRSAALEDFGVGFRMSKSDAHRHSREWQSWINRTRPELVAIGLPSEVYLDEARWLDFLENGHLHWHESSGFEFGHLPLARLAALHRFLEREYGAAERCPPLLSCVRVRCG